MTEKILSDKIFDFQYKQKLLEKNEEISKEEQEKKIQYYNKLIGILQLLKKNLQEPDKGKCDISQNSWKAGLTNLCTESNDYIQVLDFKYFSECKPFTVLDADFQDKLTGKIIVGWEISSHHENENGGKFERMGEVLGRNSFRFKVKSEFWRGCDWRLRIWAINDA